MKLSVVGMCSLLFGSGAVIGCAFTSLAVAQEPVAEVQCGATAVSLNFGRRCTSAWRDRRVL